MSDKTSFSHSSEGLYDSLSFTKSDPDAFESTQRRILDDMGNMVNPSFKNPV